MAISKKYTITIASFFLCVFAMSAFLLHLVTFTFNGFVYCALIAVSAVAFGISKSVRKKYISKYYVIIWVLSILILWLSYVFRYSSNTVLIDVVVLTCGALVILLYSKKSSDYNAALQVILFMAFVFAVGVYLQKYIPSLYKTLIRVFPNKYQSTLANRIGERIGINGFTINTGFTANYILAGIFVLLSRQKINVKPSRKSIVEIIILGFALLLTAKRGPVVFSVLAIILVGLIPLRRTQRMKRVWIIFLTVLTIGILAFLFRERLENIPFLRRYIESAYILINGGDVSSGRLKLYSWAIQLFVQNPIFGIGWGKYRTTVAGDVTFTKSLDTHNVYLQLLCETGIVGFLIFVIMFLMSWNMTKNAYFSCLTEENEELRRWRPALFFSFLFQTYFLLFSLSGNPLYDQFYQVLYVFSCSIMVAYRDVALHRYAEK